MDTTRAQIVDLLRTDINTIEQILTMFPADGYPAGGSREEVRAAVRELKDAVKFEYRRRTHMTDVEAAVYGPAMHRLFLALQPLHLGTRPGPSWRSVLLSARGELSYTIDRIERGTY